MLKLVGLGLGDGGVTSKGLKAIRSSDKVYAEFYTNTETVDLEKLEEETGKKICQLTRDEVERNDKILESATEEDVAFLISGDPITATTHYDIAHRARERGVTTEVVHAPSILTSVAETGLNIYKFGRIVTLPENSKPKSVIKHINRNEKIDLHTLVLLDIDYEAEDAAKKLIEMEPGLKENEAIFFERANSNNQEISHGKLSELKSKGPTPHSIILVGEKSYKEKEHLNAY